MCRILAWHGGKNLKNVNMKAVKKIIKGLLAAESHSNPHGTGLLGVKPEKLFLLKRGIDAVSFLVQEEERLNYLFRDARAVIGHVRYATRGEISDRNAHPFIFKIQEKKYFAGVHNGVLSYEKLLKTASEAGVKNPERYKVDSYLLFACIAQLLRNGMVFEEAVEEVLYEVEGSWALVMYWDVKIYFVRSEDRPLWVCDLRKVGLGRFIASTKKMFDRACVIAGENLRKFPHFEPLPYRLYMIENNGEVKKVKDLKVKVPVYSDYYYVPYGWDGYCDWYEDEYHGIREELEYVEAEIRDIKEYLNIMKSEFSDDPEHIYAVEEAEERLKELYRKRRKLRQALKKFKNEFIPAGDMRAGAYSYMQGVQI